MLFLAIALATGGGPAAAGGKMAGGLSLSVSTDKPLYRVGEPIVISLRLVNRWKDEVTLEFGDSQRFDFVIWDAAGREVWRWSRDQFFAQVLGSETLGPDRPQIEFQERFAGSLGPGVYRIEGSVPAQGHHLSATAAVEVR